MWLWILSVARLGLASQAGSHLSCCPQAEHCAGWDVRGGVTRLWAGDRDLDELIAQKDLGSRIALQTILNFARKFENDFGKKAI